MLIYVNISQIKLVTCGICVWVWVLGIQPKPTHKWLSILSTID